MFQKTKRRLLNFLLSYLYNSISEDEILVHNQKTNTVSVGGKLIGAKSLIGLQSDIKALKQLEWWGFMKKDLQYIANKKMYRNSQVIDDLLFGKAILYTLDVMDRKMDNFLKIK